MTDGCGEVTFSVFLKKITSGEERSYCTTRYTFYTLSWQNIFDPPPLLSSCGKWFSIISSSLQGRAEEPFIYAYRYRSSYEDIMVPTCHMKLHIFYPVPYLKIYIIPEGTYHTSHRHVPSLKYKIIDLSL
jgi:hypothetical protein